MNHKVIEYIERGHRILSSKYWETYDSIVPIRLADLYHGSELNYFLDILNEYNTNKSLENCRILFSSQHCSGLSASLILSLIRDFHDAGSEIIKALLGDK